MFQREVITKSTYGHLYTLTKWKMDSQNLFLDDNTQAGKGLLPNHLYLKTEKTIPLHQPTSQQSRQAQATRFQQPPG